MSTPNLTTAADLDGQIRARAMKNHGITAGNPSTAQRLFAAEELLAEANAKALSPRPVASTPPPAPVALAPAALSAAPSPSLAKVITRAQFNDMSFRERNAFMAANGRITETAADLPARKSTTTAR